MKRIGVGVFLLMFFSVYLFAQDAGAETGSDTPTVEVADSSEEPATDEVIRIFEGEKKLKGVKVYENRIYRDDLRGVFGNYIASALIAGDIKGDLPKKFITNEDVVAAMEKLREKDEIESVDFYYTFDDKDRVTIHVTLIDNPGFQEFEGNIRLARVDFYCRNNFFVNRRALGDAVNLKKNEEYDEKQIKEAVARIDGLRVYNNILWGLREEKKDKNGVPSYALQIIVSEYPGSKDVREQEFVVSQIRFLGNWYTKEWVYIRELDFKEGDVVNVNQLDAAAQKLMNLGVCTSVDWGILYDESGNAILVFNTRDKLTLLPSFDFAFGSDQLRLGVGFWDKNFLGTKSMIVFEFKLKDLMPVFSLSLNVPKVANTYFNIDMALSYDSTNKYTKTRKVEGSAIEIREKGYREDVVNASFGGSYSLELADKKQTMWYQEFGASIGYQFVQSKKEQATNYLGMPDSFATGWLNLDSDFQYDETKIGSGHYMNFDLSYSFNNYRNERGYRTKGINFSMTNSIGVPIALDGYMSKNQDTGQEITEKIYNTFETNFTFHYVPVHWFEFKGYMATGYTTSDIVAKQFYFGMRSLVRNIPNGMQGSGKGYYRGNFDVCFTPLIPYVSKVVIFEFALFADVGNYGQSYPEMWKQIPIWSTGLGVNVYVPFLEGLYLVMDLSWGPGNVQQKDGKPLFNFAVRKYY